MSLLNEDPVPPCPLPAPRSLHHLPPFSPFQYKNEPGYEDYDKPPRTPPPTPATTPPNTTVLTPTNFAPQQLLDPPHLPSFGTPSMGKAVEAKNYIRKIRHETLRITVIERLEGYLKIGPGGTISTPAGTVVEEEPEEDYWDDDEETRKESLAEIEAKMWVDHCKRLFLWYYNIYLVRSLPLFFGSLFLDHLCPCFLGLLHFSLSIFIDIV